jgi:thiol-disulfide isomerase/thioredoxin
MNSSHHFGVSEKVYTHGKTLAIALLLALGATIFGARNGTAQDGSLSCLGGERLSAGEMRQGTTIAIFWASWSPRSRDVFERINGVAAKWGGRARVVAINYQEDPNEVRRFLAGRKLSAPVCFDVDGTFSKSFDVSTLPVLVILKDGAVARQGRLPEDADGAIAEVIR